jgi:predicted AAA+ superfamily ATPase
MQLKKKFNSSGPNKPERHYTLERNSLMEQGEKLVYDERYFTLFAPRQSGKSTFFQMLGEQLKTEGYKVCYTNFEYFKSESLQDFLQNLGRKMREFWQINIDNSSFGTIAASIEQCNTEKLILIVDEVEGINAEYLNTFLHTIRNLYHSRDSHSLKSVILVGVQNITGSPTPTLPKGEGEV